MVTSKSVALLPLDQASIIIPVIDTPEIVTKHIDSELIRLTAVASDQYDITRRHEFDVSWLDDGRYSNLETAVLTLADRQAFGVRRGGVPSNIAEQAVTGNLPDAGLEIEPLDRGGIIIDNNNHLPLILHTVDGMYWRARWDQMVELDDFPDEKGAYVLESKSDTTSNWEVVKILSWEAMASGAVNELTERAGVTTLTNPSTEAMIEIIESADPHFVSTDIDSVPKDITHQLALQDKTLNFDRDE